MDSPSSKCRHPDIRKFDSVRCCLACGLALFDEPRVHNTVSQDDGLTSYSYKRLNHELGQEIRLVVVLPRSSWDKVHVRIEHVNLLDKPTYEAVSYTWQTQDGDGSLSECIYHEDKTIAVTKNCLAALLHLSSGAWEERVLWIDAVCIDQNNIQGLLHLERNHQVRMMNVIYSNAYQVLIYLGEESGYGPFQPKEHPLDSLSKNHLPTDEDYMRQFLDRRWFDRVWVLQEIALAKSALLIVGGDVKKELQPTNFKTMLVKGKAIPWTFLTTGLLIGLYSRWRLPPPSVLFWAPGSMPNHPNLLDVLDRSRNCSATDPRDKVFAVLNLVDADYQEYIPVDYSRSVEDVYVAVARDLIMRKRLIGVLSHACAKSEDVKFMAIPSWVPEWTRKNVTMLPRQFSGPQVKLFSSSWSFDATLEVPSATLSNDIWDNDLPASELDGPVVSTATWRYRLFMRSRDGNGKKVSRREVSRKALEVTQSHNKDFHFAISKREMCVGDLRSTYPEFFLHRSPELSSALECLRIRGHLLGVVCWTGALLNDLKSSLGGYMGYFKSLGLVPRAFGTCGCARLGAALLENLYSYDGDYDSTSPVGKCLMLSQRHGTKGTIFYTQTSMGISLLTLQNDDSVWALDGAHLPYILRYVHGHYILVGECYYYGAMEVIVCPLCGTETPPVPIMHTEIIDIW